MVCPMCGKEFEGRTSDALPGKHLCLVCEEAIQTLVNSKNTSELLQAKKHVYYCKAHTQDSDVWSALEALIGAHKELPADAPVWQESGHHGFDSLHDKLVLRNRMFDQAGKKLMSAAKFVCIVGTVVCLFLGIVMCVIGTVQYGGELLIISGIAIALVGSFFSWLGSLVLYGFGEIVNNSRLLVEFINEREKQ